MDNPSRGGPAGALKAIRTRQLEPTYIFVRGGDDTRNIR